MLRLFARARKPSVTGMVAAAICLTSAGVVFAHHANIDTMFPTDNTAQVCHKGKVCQTDGPAVTYHYGASMTLEAKNRVNTTINETYRTTVLTFVYQSPAKLGGPGDETDIVYRINKADVPDDLIGFTWCDSLASSSIRCDQQYVSFKKEPTIGLACHETGHAVGLVHGKQAEDPVDNNADFLGCMQRNDYDRYLRPHNKWMIDHTY